jgi:hypothetical protein
MNTIEQVASLKKQAIDLLLNEREQIDRELTSLGHGDKKDPAALKRRGRPPKHIFADHSNMTDGDGQELTSEDLFETTPART